MPVDRRRLLAIHKELEAATEQTEALIKSVRKLEEAYAVQRRTAEAEAKRAKKAALKRKAALRRTTDGAINVIRKSKKGVDAATLMKKTGYDQNQVRNILARAYKQGKIKRAGWGIYVAA